MPTRRISVARASDFHKVAVYMFYALLIEIIDKHKLTASQIFNMNETGITCVPKS